MNLAQRWSPLTVLVPAALVALAVMDGCSNGGGGASSTPGVSPTPGPTATAGTLSASGVAYLPDNGTGTSGITVVHFEDVYGNAIAARSQVTLPQSLQQFALVSTLNTGTLGIAASAPLGATGPYTAVQPIGQAAQGTPFALGHPLDLTAALVGKIDAVAVFPSADVGLVLGSNQTLSGVNGLTTGTPAFAGSQSIAFDGGASPAPSPTPTPAVSPTPVPYTRSAMVLSASGSSLLVRGTDLVAYQITAAQAGYTIKYLAENSSFGGVTPAAAPTLLGRGGMTFFPGDSTRAVIVQSTAGSGDVTVVGGLPATITQGAHLTLSPPTTANSVALTPAANVAVVGTSTGLYSVNGILTSTLSQVNAAPFSPKYTDSFGATRALTNVASVGISADGRYVVAVAVEPSGGQTRASLLVFTIDANGNLAGTSSGAPVEVVNNVPVPAGDTLVTR